MSKPDNKEKTIAMMATTIAILTVCLIAALILLLVRENQRVNARLEPEPFFCGVIDDHSNLINTLSADGKALFKTNCSSCHTYTDQSSTGPGLKGAIERIPGGNWVYTFIRNGDSLQKSGDPYIATLAEVYPMKYPHRFPLTNEQIDAILQPVNHIPVQ